MVYGSASVDDFRAETLVPPPLLVQPLPATARKFEHIRIAQLAYGGQRITDVEKNQLATSVDLVVANPAYLDTFEAASATTPKTVYSNVSNIYEGLLEDWLAASGSNREAAFYHVAQPTPFSGSSSSSTPVAWFWNAWKTDGSTAIKVNAANGVSFGPAGSAFNLGGLDRFHEVNVYVSQASAHTGVWEYTVGSEWKPLAIAGDGTNGLSQNGCIRFDPPADWTSRSVGSTESLFYVRYRVLSGTGPVASKILGRDYVNAFGSTTGTIPAFDSVADANADGYLNDAEYNTRRGGFDARFVSESRLFWPYYGQMRFVVNPASDAVQDWAAGYHADILASLPNADGLFLDNQNGKLPFSTPVLESTANYSADSADLVAAVKTAIGNRSVIVNTSGAGAGAYADGVTKAGGIAFEEFLLRPTTANWSTVNDVAAVVAKRLSASPTSEVILDSHPGTNSLLDARTRMGVLSYYYLLADPSRTYLMFFGGYAPASSWQQRSLPAASVNVGLPTGNRTVFASGKDPANAQLEYRVFSRNYSGALVLYKPLSYTLGKGTGTPADATATTHALGGNYRLLNADGSRGPVITSITLRNGEGVVLLKASGAA